jgi:hypothetical protein
MKSEWTEAVVAAETLKAHVNGIIIHIYSTFFRGLMASRKKYWLFCLAAGVQSPSHVM